MNNVLPLAAKLPINTIRVVVSNPSATLNTAECTENNSEVTLGDCGLVVHGPSVVPVRLDLRRQWYDTIRNVLADGEPRYFSIHRCEGLNVVGLTTDDSRAVVVVHLPRRAVCSRIAVGRLVEIVAATPRERDVLECLAEGLAPREIAKVLGTRLSTVRTQIKSLLAKLELSGTRPLLHFLARLPEV